MEIITTADGSHTLFSSQFNEIYHSRNGAIQESRHVFLNNGLLEAARRIKEGNAIRIYEVGFGTGLNALLSAIEAEKQGWKMDYDTVELYPVPMETIMRLNYMRQLGFTRNFGAYHTVHLVRWDEWHQINDYLRFRKTKGSIVELPLDREAYDLIYFDAFAPEHQPEMWTRDIFQKMIDALVPGGLLVTYCSKGSVQRTMKEVGFEIEKLPGPPGKREMIRAKKI